MHIKFYFLNFATSITYGTMNEIIGRNIKKLRKANKFTQDDIAIFLGIERSAYANYEAGARSFPLPLLEKIANLLGCELCILFERDINNLNNVLTCAFRINNLGTQDMEQIAKFKNIVNNYLKMKRIESEHESQ